MPTIGVFGTAKNTGKTTTIVSLLKTTLERGHMVGLTGIGYDGEKLDNITGLPKPSYYLPEGVLLATAERTLPPRPHDFQVIKKTGIDTALGKVWLVRVKKPGSYVVAGPTRTGALRTVLRELGKMGALYLYVDGALNRLVPLSAAGGLIMATGAAKTPDLEKLVEETAAICALFQVPHFTKSMPGRVTLENSKEHISLPFTSILIVEEVLEVLDLLKKGEYRSLFIPGYIPLDLLEVLKSRLSAPLEVVFSDITRLLVSGEPFRVLEFIEANRDTLSFKVNKKIPLYGVTVNPYYPLYRWDFNEYEAAYIDGDLLLKKMKQSLSVPVTDVFKTDSRILFEAIEVR